MPAPAKRDNLELRGADPHGCRSVDARQLSLENRRLKEHVPRMLESHHRSCKCGAVYSRSEAMAPARQINSFECSVCGVTMEHWNTAWVPSYRLIAGPVSNPEHNTSPRSA
jgi:hypothetical protein